MDDTIATGPTASVTLPKKEKPRGDPESRFYDTLKRQKIRFWLKGDSDVTHGVLEWVSTYSLGVSINGETTLVMKSALKTIRLA